MSISELRHTAGMDDKLAALARAHGVATWYRDGERRRVDIEPSVVVAVLAQLGVDASTPQAIRQELAKREEAERRQLLPPTIVLRKSDDRLMGKGVRWLTGRSGEIECEDGRRLSLHDDLAASLPLGWHTLVCGEQRVTLVVAPARLARPPRTWGWMLQLYGLHSRDSWGMGDLGDLRSFTAWAADQGAGMILVNPLHAITPLTPIERSPYSPSSRSFINPLYLRVTDTTAYARADERIRAQVDALRPDDGGDLVDYDMVWKAKHDALELLFPGEQAVDLDAIPGLREFATFCALAERYGRNWHEWPEPLRHPGTAAVAAARRELSSRVAFHAWLQQLCAEQLAEVSRVARRMGIGVVHDLAVGCDPNGADAWALQDVLASGVSVGAPPDAFNQQGQNWGLPPWHPIKLAEAGYQPYAQMMRAVLGHANGLRIDHVPGLWRLWWIPPGEPATRGTYVYYDAEALIGVLTLEAYRAGAVVVGEDLGTVEPEVTQTLHEHNMLGSAVLWFTREEPERTTSDMTSNITMSDITEEGAPASAVASTATPPQGAGAGTGAASAGKNGRTTTRASATGVATSGDGADCIDQASHTEPPLLPPQRWPVNAVATITTHDLPTAAGFLTAEHVKVRAELGVLIDDVSTEMARAAAEREELIGLLRAEGLLPDTPDDVGESHEATDIHRIVVAMHALLAKSASRVVLAAPGDAVGMIQQPNLPGTLDQYPNWRIKLPMPLEKWYADPRVARIVSVLKTHTT